MLGMRVFSTSVPVWREIRLSAIWLARKHTSCLSSGDGKGHDHLHEAVIKETAGVLFCKDLSSADVGEHPAQEPVGENQGHRAQGEHEGDGQVGCQLDLVLLICPYENIVVHRHREHAGGWIVVLLRVDGLVIGPLAGMEGEGLPPHQTQDQAKHMKEDHEIADVPHELGGGPGIPGRRQAFGTISYLSPHEHHTRDVLACQ